MSIVKHAEELVAQRLAMGKKYDAVWLVFDLDDTPHSIFDNAIASAVSKRNRFLCAWSNPQFELWLLLHFKNITTPIARLSYVKHLDEELKSLGHKSGYHKNDPNLFQIINLLGDQNKAVSRAEVLVQSSIYQKSDANRDPCTMVHLLINELVGYLQK
jgi:RloB-like protein